MADIKMCDKCGGMFNPRGAWQSLTAITFTIADEDGLRQVRHDSTLELCGACAIDPRQAESQSPVMRGALATGRQLVDEEADVWRDPDGSYHVKRGAQWIGPFSSEGSATGWIRNERPRPYDEGSEE